MATLTRFMLIGNSVLCICLTTACSSKRECVPSINREATCVLRIDGHRLQLAIHNSGPHWLVAENLFDADDRGVLNTEHAILQCGRYEGKTAGAARPAIIIEPHSTQTSLVDLRKSYSGLGRQRIEFQRNLNLSVSGFFTNEDASRFVTAVEKATQARQCGKAAVIPPFRTHIPVRAKSTQ